MPNKCCIPNCKSNYSSCSSTGYVSCFKFPKDPEIKNAWISKIPRKEWTPGNHSVVCIKHFEEKCLIKEPGTPKISLTNSAVPTIFPNCPSYLTSTTPKERKSPEERKTKILERLDQKQEEWLNSDKIENYQVLLNKVSQFLISPWKQQVETTSLLLYTVRKTSHTLEVFCSIEIIEDMNVAIYVQGGLILSQDIKWVLQSGTKLDRWSQLENLLSRYKHIPKYEATVNSCMVNCMNSLKELVSTLQHSEKYVESAEEQKCRFLLEQLQLIFAQKKIYSSNMLIWAFIIYSYSPSAYAAIRATGNVVLPHLKYLKQLSSAYLISPDKAAQNKHFLHSVSQKLSVREKYVALQMDEIYVKQRLEYKKGELIGLAENKPTVEAKTIQTFLISSVFGNAKEVVSLHPVEKLSGGDLFQIVIKILTLLKSCDFQVIAIISDNNRINQACFTQLCMEEKLEILREPKFDCTTYLTYDSVHIFKNIRNNWLNAKGPDQTFIIPDFEDASKAPLIACFSDLRNYYKKYCGSLLSQAYKLNHKSLYPSNIERQKVALVCNVFHETTYCALEVESQKNPKLVAPGTVLFIKIITQWWSIMNTKSTLLGVFKRNSWILPFNNLDDDRLKFLKKFVEWLEVWKQKYPQNSLTNDTFSALRRSTLVMISFIKYSLEDLKISYVLPGKLQTDNLERRFSAYRQMSGGNYHVSVSQVIESEKKLRLKSLLGIKSAKFGNISLDLEVLEDTVNYEVEYEATAEDFSTFEEIVFTNYLEKEIDESSLIFIAGYSPFKILKKFRCECNLCVELLTCSDEIDDEYFNLLNRGGLTVPSEHVLKIARHTVCMMTMLMSAEYEEEFLKFGNQKKLLFHLVMKGINAHEENLYNKFRENCLCQCYYGDFLNNLVKTFCNISLNNYVKLKNNVLPSNVNQKRKLLTLEKKVSAKKSNIKC